jgi:beta-lactamase regulating signal transducer with metallopeptidase domain/HEAT repeat protein
MTVEVIGWAIVHSLWQGALVAALLGLILTSLRKAPAAWRHWLCLVAMIMLVALPLATSLRSTRLPNVAQEMNARQGSAPVKTQPSTISQDVDEGKLPTTSSSNGPVTSAAASRGFDVTRYMPWLVGLWAVGVLLLSLRVIGGYVWARRLVNVGTTQVSTAIAAAAQRIAQQLYIRAAVRVLESSRAQVPMVIGFLKPVVLLPTSLLTGLTPQQIEAILAHELAHVRRYDYALNVMQTIFETLMFYHPAMWWLSRRMRDEREQACDELAVSLCGGDPYFYSRVLLAVEEWRSARISFAPAATGGSLSLRVRKLIGEEDRKFDVGPRWFAGIVTIIALISTAGSAAREELQAEPPSESFTMQDTARARPGTVTKYSGSQDLPDRVAWAHTTANDSNYRNYWIGYTIDDAVNAREWIFIDRDSPVRAGDTWISGRMRFGGDFKNLKFSGVSLSESVGDYAPRQHTVLLGFDGSGRRPKLLRVHMANFIFPMHFNGWPLMWLQNTNGAASIATLAAMREFAADAEVMGDLPAAIGAHADRRVATPILSRWATDSREPREMRNEAIHALAQQEDPEALAIIARIARRDRDEGLRVDAVEALAELPVAAAADTLLAFARSLETSQLRLEAIEALGERKEPQIAGWLDRIARTGDYEARNEAVESLAHLPDGDGLARLVDLANDARVESTTRLEAVEALGDVESPEAIKVLRRIIFEDEDFSMQIKATETLSNLESAQAVELLLKVAETHKQINVQSKAAEALGNVHEHELAIRALQNILETNSESLVRVSAIEALGNIEDSRAAAIIMRSVLNDVSEDVRAEAAESLGHLRGSAEILKFIEESLANPRVSYRVKIELMEALNDMADDAGLPLLKKIARSSDANLREKALELVTER